MTPEPLRLADNAVLIIGAGLAGLFLALRRLPQPSWVVSPAPLGEGASSAWAQGGLAAALGPQDNPALHAADTIKVGAGLVDPAIARLIAEEGPARVQDLLALDVPFDRDAAGALILSLEAAHSHPRVARVSGDRAGAAIMEALIAHVRASPAITVIEGARMKDLLRDDHGRCAGALVATENGGFIAVSARETVLATGGVGGLYRVTTNPPAAVGAGLASALTIGAVLAGLEFVQFHPTAIDIGLDPAPLATEALRGDGATLINADGRQFMADYHKDRDLAPRDVVARAIESERAAGRATFLDCRTSLGDHFKDAFPTVFESCMRAGLDPRVAAIPVAPAAHYHMGGIVTDLWGRSSVYGLSAIGECANTGAHGANRLASNSLLEAVVFADRVARRQQDDPPGPVGAPLLSPPTPECPQAALRQVRALMSENVAVRRQARGLQGAMQGLDDLLARHGACHAIIAARLICEAALARCESRGAHFRADYPHTDDAVRQSFSGNGL